MKRMFTLLQDQVIKFNDKGSCSVLNEKQNNINLDITKMNWELRKRKTIRKKGKFKRC